jgi:hypothetical protein
MAAIIIFSAIATAVAGLSVLVWLRVDLDRGR